VGYRVCFIDEVIKRATLPEGRSLRVARGTLKMKLSRVQDQAIAARMALIVGATTFDRLFAGVRFDEVDGDLLYVFAMDEETAAEMEDRFSLHISIVATDILMREIGIVLVLPKKLAR